MIIVRALVFLAAVARAASAGAVAAAAVETTVDGWVKEAAGRAVISDGRREFSVNESTGGRGMVRRGCPIGRGGEAPCVVTFLANGSEAVEILSASAPVFGGATIDRPGTILVGYLCGRKADAGRRAQPGCSLRQFLAVWVVAADGNVAEVRWEGLERFAGAGDILLNCGGSALTIAAQLDPALPPMLKC